MQKLESDRGTRDNYIHTHGIDSDKYQQSKFKLTKPIALPAGLKKCAVEHVDRDGSAHAARRDEDGHGAAPGRVGRGPTIQVDASRHPIVLADYKIAPPKTSVIKADDNGTIEFALSFTPA